MAARPRIILALPNASECAVVADWLVADGFEPVRRSTPATAADEVKSGRTFDLIVADAALAARTGLINAGRERNPRTPTVLIADAVVAGRSRAADSRAMELTRPVDRANLLCTVAMAILEGRQVRRSARTAVNRFAASVNDAPAHIIDVSNEGLRLEIPRDRGTAPPPPYFRVRLPLLGAAVAVKRMWARPWPGRGQTEVTLCGAALLSQNRSEATKAWQLFVDTIATAGNATFDPLQL